MRLEYRYPSADPGVLCAIAITAACPSDVGAVLKRPLVAPRCDGPAADQREDWSPSARASERRVSSTNGRHR